MSRSQDLIDIREIKNSTGASSAPVAAQSDGAVGDRGPDAFRAYSVSIVTRCWPRGRGTEYVPLSVVRKVTGDGAASISNFVGL